MKYGDIIYIVGGFTTLLALMINVHFFLLEEHINKVRAELLKEIRSKVDHPT